MLGPDLLAMPPTGAAAQREFVRTSLELAVHVRAHCWKDVDLVGGVEGRPDVPHAGERGAAEVFDVLGRLMLPHASPEGWTAAFVTDLAGSSRGDARRYFLLCDRHGGGADLAGLPH